MQMNLYRERERLRQEVFFRFCERLVDLRDDDLDIREKFVSSQERK